MYPPPPPPPYGYTPGQYPPPPPAYGQNPYPQQPGYQPPPAGYPYPPTPGYPPPPIGGYPQQGYPPAPGYPPTQPGYVPPPNYVQPYPAQQYPAQYPVNPMVIPQGYPGTNVQIKIRPNCYLCGGTGFYVKKCQRKQCKDCLWAMGVCLKCNGTGWNKKGKVCKCKMYKIY
ncbi:unnamed protein product [Paramecium sonneborni]|uniref:Uncharacterized protein n=1 Tax=Paramecium sonneborni TaxID=65129 RepID=A0A8S1LAX0_9CILI|nr:unnamed protein product [Paramecium sonneborni]